MCKNFVPADGPALLGAKPSAATAMAKIVVYKIWQAVPSMIERSLLMRANICIMMTSSNGNIFRVTGHLCGEFTGPRWIPRTKAMTRSFDVFFDLRRINGRVNNGEVGDLRRHRTHCDVIVMLKLQPGLAIAWQWYLGGPGVPLL